MVLDVLCWLLTVHISCTQVPGAARGGRCRRNHMDSAGGVAQLDSGELPRAEPSTTAARAQAGPAAASVRSASVASMTLSLRLCKIPPKNFCWLSHSLLQLTIG